MSEAPTLSFEDHARKLVAARYSLVYVETHEEARLERLISGLAQRAFSQPVAFFSWSATEGLRSQEEAHPGTEDPRAALDAVIAHPKAGLFLFKDLHRFYDDPRVVRRMRDLHHTCRNKYKTVFISGALLNVPVECEKEISILDLPLPNTQDMDRIFDRGLRGLTRTLAVELGDAREALLRGALGLTEEEACAGLHQAAAGAKTVGPEIIERLYEEKREIVRKEGILRLRPAHGSSWTHIGGLRTLKDWLRQRKRFFTHEAEDFGLDPPKGLLVTGISGCGKSMAVQAISSYWKMPLLRLDMNRVYAAWRVRRSEAWSGPSAPPRPSRPACCGSMRSRPRWWARAAQRRRSVHPHLLLVSDLDAGEGAPGLRGGHGQRDRQAAPRAAAQGTL